MWRAAVAMSAAGVVHGDFSPFNVLVEDAASIRVIDFPQAVSIQSPTGMELCNAIWTTSPRGSPGGVPLDADAWFGECIASAF